MHLEVLDYIHYVKTALSSRYLEEKMLFGFQTKLLDLIQRYPEDAWRIWEVLGETYEKINCFSEAENCYRFSIRERESASGYFHLFCLAVREKDWDRIQAILHDYFSYQHDLDCKTEMERFAMLLSFEKETKDSFPSFLREDKQDYLAIGLEEARIGNYDRALAILKRLSKRRPYPILFYMFLCQEAKNKTANKEEPSSISLSSLPPLLRLKECYQLLDSGNWKEGEALFYEMLQEEAQLFPRSALAFLEKKCREMQTQSICLEENQLMQKRYRQIGTMASSLDEDHLALSYYQEALQRTKDYHFYFDIGVSYYRMGRFQEALLAFEKYDAFCVERFLESQNYQMKIHHHFMNTWKETELRQKLKLFSFLFDQKAFLEDTKENGKNLKKISTFY